MFNLVIAILRLFQDVITNVCSPTQNVNNLSYIYVSRYLLRSNDIWLIKQNSINKLIFDMPMSMHCKPRIVFAKNIWFIYYHWYVL